MIGYVLLTHGPKPQGSIANHPAAGRQLANLQFFCAQNAAPMKRAAHDYARSFDDLRTLPHLTAILAAMLEQQNDVTVMDDLGRLFRACQPIRRNHLLEQLAPFADHLFGVRQGKKLSGMSHTAVLLMASGRESSHFSVVKQPRNGRSEDERREQTENANLASRVARGRAADERAKTLDAIRQELTADGSKPTLKMIAEVANSRGLTTARNGTWSAATVGRSLSRLKEPTLAERARANLASNRENPEAG